MRDFYSVFIENCNSPYSSITESQKEVIKKDYYERKEDVRKEEERGFFREIPSEDYHWVSIQIINELEFINEAQSGMHREQALPNSTDKEKDINITKKFLERLTTQERKDTARPLVIISEAILRSGKGEEFYDKKVEDFDKKIKELTDLSKWYLAQISDIEKTSYSHTRTITRNGEKIAKRDSLQKVLFKIAKEYNISNSTRRIKYLILKLHPLEN